MSIYRQGKEITGIHRKGRDTSEVWKYINGAWRIVWEAIRSCFSRGFWINEQPWNNADGWKNE